MSQRVCAREGGWGFLGYLPIFPGNLSRDPCQRCPETPLGLGFPHRHLTLTLLACPFLTIDGGLPAAVCLSPE